MDDYIVGNIVKGEITGIESYGLFVKLDNDYTGLVHISEITNNFVKDINNYDISNAILIDNFISYTRFGNPRYFLVYKFEDSSIMEFQVTADEYYRLGECE